MRLITAFIVILGVVSLATAQTVSDDGTVSSVNAQSYSGLAAGTTNPTFIDMTGNGVTFTGGSSYGIYVNLTSYNPNGSRLIYTDGIPTNYSQLQTRSADQLRQG